MVNLLANIVFLQTGEISSRGLPYWTFWLLLCIILLLIAFIFLRDKSLRQRLNSFFSRLKGKMVKIRLQAKRKKEKQKKEELLKELGATAWIEGIRAKESEQIEKDLIKLEKDKSRFLKETKEADSKIKMLNKNLEEYTQKFLALVKDKETEINPYKEKIGKTEEKVKFLVGGLNQKQKEIEETEKQLKAVEKEIQEIENNPELSDKQKKAKKEEIKEKIKNLKNKKEKTQKNHQSLKEEKAGLDKEKEKLKGKIGEYERQIKDIEEEKKEQARKSQKEIKEWEKNRGKIQEKIREIDRQKDPLFKNLGKIINELRVDHKKLFIFYSQIDRVNKRIQDIEKNIEKI